ncbi:MAG: Gfo/Idh/MocA family protein [Flavobacteriales bacterium]|jgi:predicted dehydrogenase|tara:strand:- start:4016 stop:4972 length:957 start_codon:yes stop_codon:yes gene_type:complete
MIKAGVIGTGHLGSIHLKLLSESNFYHLIGFYDKDLEKSKKLSNNYVFFKDFNQLINSVDVVFICSNTPTHYSIAKACLEKNRHVFIEKPITSTVEEAKELVDLASHNNLIGQVGHVERFNPAFVSLKKTIINPKFIECHRLAEFNPRGNDVSVVLDLMIHDIDIVLSLVKSKIKSVSANGVCVISETPDITNARVEFENGCVANFTSSRISLKNMRKTRIFQNDAYISVDFLEKKSEVVKISNEIDSSDKYAMIIENSKGDKKHIYYKNPEITTTNAIVEEHNSFANSITNNSKPEISLEDGYSALKLANEIINKIQ